MQNNKFFVFKYLFCIVIACLVALKFFPAPKVFAAPAACSDGAVGCGTTEDKGITAESDATYGHGAIISTTNFSDSFPSGLYADGTYTYRTFGGTASLSATVVAAHSVIDFGSGPTKVTYHLDVNETFTGEFCGNPPSASRSLNTTQVVAEGDPLDVRVIQVQPCPTPPLGENDMFAYGTLTETACLNDATQIPGHGQGYYTPTAVGVCTFTSTGTAIPTGSITVTDDKGDSPALVNESSLSGSTTLTPGAKYQVVYTNNGDGVSCDANQPNNFTQSNLTTSGTYTMKVSCPPGVGYSPPKSFFAKVKGWLFGKDALADSSITLTLSVTDPPVPASCGTAAKEYSYSDSSYGADTFCSSGSSVPASPAWPAAGSSTSWTCGAATCSASHDGPPSPPTASLLADGLSFDTVAPGQTVNYTWSSTNGTSWSSTYAGTDGSSGSWGANTANGSSSGVISNAQAGYTYIITYRVTGPGGSASSRIIVAVSGLTSCTTRADCPGTEICTGGTCGPLCSGPADCNDSNACTTDICNSPASTISYCSNTNNPVNGNWSAWSVCSGGTQTRVCNNPSQACGGLACSGPSSRICYPSISLSPTSFSFNGISGGTTPAGQTLTISDTSNGTTLNWSAAPTGAGTWCHVSPSSGVAPYGSPSTVTVSVDSPSAIGTFNNCSIQVSDPAADNNPQTAAVTYTVSAASCPAPGSNLVNLSSSSIQTGNSSTASAPANFTGGSFTSGNPGVATVSGNTITGVSTGTSVISGSGWTYTPTGATSCALGGTTLTVTPPGGICPAPGSNLVGLSPSTIHPGNTSTASAPANFTGGSFASSNVAVATVSGSTVTGASNGSSSVSGSGWTYTPNGATSCALGGSTLTVSTGGVCTTLTYNPATSGISVYPSGPPISHLNLTPGQSFYAFVDYGAVTDAIIPPYVIAPGSPGYPSGYLVCTSPTWSGTVERFTCPTDPLPGHTVTWGFSTGTNNDPSGSNICASGPIPVGTVSTDFTPNPASLDLTTGPACKTISASWPAVAGAASYNLYRNNINSSNTATRIPNVTSPYPDSGLTPGSYYYWVSAIDTFSAEENSDYTPASSNSTGGTAALACTGNLSKSDKDILAINGSDVNYPSSGGPPQACNASTDPLPASTIMNLGDKLKFALNLCNNGNTSTGPASNISVTDSMINLVVGYAPGDAGYVASNPWNLKYNGTALTQGPGVNHYQVTGTAPNQIITVNLTSTTLATSTVGTLTYEAKTGIPSNFTGNLARFQNSFTINYNNGLAPAVASGNTPLLPFFIIGGSPTIHEIP